MNDNEERPEIPCPRCRGVEGRDCNDCFGEGWIQ